MQLYTKILIGMAVGVVLGLLVGPGSPLLPQNGVVMMSSAVVHTKPSADAPEAPASEGIKRAKILESRGSDPTWLRIEWKLSTADVLRIEKKRTEEKREEKREAKGRPKTPAAQGAEDERAPGPPPVDPEEARPERSAEAQPAPAKLERGVRYSGWVALEEPAVSTYAPIGQRLIDYTEWLGLLFLALIKMVVVPLVFFSLTVGVASLGDFRRLGRMGGRTIGMFMLTTVVSLTIGVGLANLLRPGGLIDPNERARLVASYEGDAESTVEAAAEAPTLTDQLIAIVPENPIESLARGDMLQIIFFALMFGVALTLIDEKRSKPVVNMLDYANEAMVMLVHIAMMLAPFGVAALLFKVVGSTGLSVLLALSYYGLVVLAGLLAHLFITYGSIVRFGARLAFLPFLKAIRPAMLLAFSTSSSSATLPVTKECMEDNLAVSPPVSSFVVPLGATINMDGTALYQGVAAIFIAQIYGMDLSLGDQVTIVTSATLASVGAAGVPGAGMITLAMVLTTIGVPTEGLALVLGVDRLLDMFRTATNVVGDSSVTAMMARLEGDELRFLSKEEDATDPKKGFEHRLDEDPHPVKPEDSD